MHAVVSTVRIEDIGLARAALAELRLEMVPRAPGFRQCLLVGADR
jgi:hypothetical protein